MPARSITAFLLAAVAVLAIAAPAVAAPGDLPRILESAPANVEGVFYDDHSIGGDNHLGWHQDGDLGESGEEPQAIRFEARISIAGPGDLELCGYPVLGSNAWLRAFQARPGDLGPAGSCPATAPADSQVGWFRYVIANHNDDHVYPQPYDRWHVMDLERYALVPLPTAFGGPPAGTPVIWDNHWGTCLNLASSSYGCEQGNGTEPEAAMPSHLDVGTGLAGPGKLTQVGTPDAQMIPISAEMQRTLPEGNYQVVALANPYGVLAEDGGVHGSVACTNVRYFIDDAPGRVGWVTTEPVALPTQGCYVPEKLDPAVTGPGGVDPMRDAEKTNPRCTVHSGIGESGHCWMTMPTDGPYKPVRTNATGNPTVTTTRLLPQGSAIPADISATGLPAPGPGPSAPSSGTTTAPPASAGSTTPSTTSGTDSTARPAMQVAVSRVRTALRRVFGTGLRRVTVVCRARGTSAASCTVRWRKGSARYSGHIYLRDVVTSTGALRWQYRVDVTRRKDGRTTHVRRAYRVGGAR